MKTCWTITCKTAIIIFTDRILRTIISSCFTLIYIITNKSFHGSLSHFLETNGSVRQVERNRAFSTVIAIGFITSLTLAFIAPSGVDTDGIDVTIGSKRWCIAFVHIFTYYCTSGWTCTGNRISPGNRGNRDMKTMIAFTSVTATIIYTVRVDWTLR